MKDENGRLRKILSEKDYEINQLKKKLSAEKETVGPISSDVAATKIVELAKKVRELTAQLESEKTKSKQLMNSKNELESKLLKSGTKSAPTGTKTRQKKSETDDDDDGDSDGEGKSNDNTSDYEKLFKENKELKEKLLQTSQRMTEFKSQSEILKQELKKTHRALEKEVGDQVDIKSILSGQSNWRGRQQQIRTLQSKVAELKQQLGGLDERSSQMMDDDLTYEMMDMTKEGNKSAQFSTYSTRTHSTKLDSSTIHRNDIRRLERDKREKNEKMAKEVEAIESDYNALKEKCEGFKAR